MSKAHIGGRRLMSAVGAVAGGLGAVQTTNAEVVFQDVNLHAHPEEVFIDLNNDGIREFRLGASITSDPACCFVTGIKADNFAGSFNQDTQMFLPGIAGVIWDSSANATNLAPGTVIGPADLFSAPNVHFGLTRLSGDTDAVSGQPAGNFNPPTASGFIGVQFDIAGNTHYGYVGYTGEGGVDSGGTVTKIGYETTPGLGIEVGSEASISANVGLAGDFNDDNSVDAGDYITARKLSGTELSLEVWNENFGTTGGAGAAGGVPEPTSLALLAAGAGGLSLYRRRQSKNRDGSTS